MRLLLCGTRGSTAAPGADFVRYGGHTSCIAVSHDGGAPSLVLDAGTGLRRLAKELGKKPFEGTILLGHLHWDHTQGLPFFRSGEHPESRVTVTMPAQGDPQEVLSRALGPPHFPLVPSQLRGNWGFAALEAGTHQIEGFTVTALDIPHPGGRTFGYRVSDESGSFAYMSDHSPISVGPGPDGLGDYHQTATALTEGTDLLVHDAQLLASEFPAKAFLGHSAVEYAVGLARHCAVPRLLLFHHDPDRTDQELDKIVVGLRPDGLSVSAAAEGDTVQIGAPK